MEQYVVKRNGEKEKLSLGQIITRVENLSMDLKINMTLLLGKIIPFITNNIKTSDIDEITCRESLGLYTIHNDYGVLAARIVTNNHNKKVYNKYSFAELTKNLNLRENLASCILNRCKELQKMCKEYQLKLNYSGFFKMMNSHYLMHFYESVSVSNSSETNSQTKTKTKVYETVEYSIMRSAVSLVAGNDKWDLNEQDLLWVNEIYRGISLRLFTFATPVYLNSGFRDFQGSSCIVIHIDDNLRSINLGCNTISLSSKYGSGIGVNLSYIRGRGQPIKGTNGISDGLIPLTKVIDKWGKYINQGGGKRPGAISPYICCWHMDLIDVIKQRSVDDPKLAIENHMLHYGLWMSDLFLRTYLTDETWYMFSPDDVDLNEYHDEYFTLDYSDRSGEFTKRYFQYVAEKRYKFTIRARELGDIIGTIWAGAGVPYVCGRDAFNRCRNQKPIIHSSNLCTEISLPSGLIYDQSLGREVNEVGVCNLSAVNVARYIKKLKTNSDMSELKLKWTVKNFDNTETVYYFDEQEFEKQVRLIVRTIDRLIDINYYVMEETKFSNMKRRPLAIGKLGIADALCKLKIPYSEGAEFNAQIQEALYYYAVDESCELAKKLGSIRDYSEYRSSEGLLQPHLFAKYFKIPFAQRYDWAALGEKAKSGMRHSVLCANMPTGNVSLIMGASPSSEPYETNIYKHSALIEESVIINKRMRKDLEQLIPEYEILQKFTEQLIEKSGKLGNMQFPKPVWVNNQTEKSEYFRDVERFREIYKSARFEISPKEIIDLYAAAQPYCDQAQSMNLWTYSVSSDYWNYIIYAAASGLKTWVYYTKSSPSNSNDVCKSCIV